MLVPFNNFIREFWLANQCICLFAIVLCVAVLLLNKNLLCFQFKTYPITHYPIAHVYQFKNSKFANLALKTLIKNQRFDSINYLPSIRLYCRNVGFLSVFLAPD